MLVWLVHELDPQFEYELPLTEHGMVDVNSELIVSGPVSRVSLYVPHLIPKLKD
jgi:hypothetical protein